MEKPALEERFKSFLRQLPGAEDVDGTLTEAQLPGRRADFLLRDRRIVLELKSLTNDPEHKIEERLGPHRDRPEFPVFYWQSDLSEILPYLPDGAEIRREIFHALTRAIQGYLEDADDQIADTKQALGLPEACGVVAILNEKIQILRPDVITAKASQMLLKTKNGGARYKNIAYVWIISEAHQMIASDGVEQLPIILLEGPMADCHAQFGDYIGHLNSAWAEFERVPLRSSYRIENFDRMSFQDRVAKPPKPTLPPGMITRQESRERQYQQRPYLRSLSESDFLTHMARLFTTMMPHFHKDGRKFSEPAIKEPMRGWTHVLTEARYRRLDMKKLRPLIIKNMEAARSSDSIFDRVVSERPDKP
jgi:hypothetical protein